uniref:PHD finger protein 10 n=1 Tax=Myotis myotis TaxID=51298 RepID=A0A7J7S233_MYOMY|nr:hypothetical protein mMyoMyo1_010088 [Myotis myotis]
MEERRAHFDLQTHVIQVPQGKYKVLPTEQIKVSSYPVALIPGQFQEYYKRYSPDELRYLPLNTALYEPPLDPELPALDSEGDSDDAEDRRGDEKRRNKGTSPKVIPNALCGICLKGKESNKKGKAEPLIHCSQCENSGHPSCLDMTMELVSMIKTYPWQCMECKTCIVCGQPYHEEEMMFCDVCDRGYHTFCVGLSPIPSAPEGHSGCGFEHPSEVQHQCTPQAILGMDVLCQAQSGMGKTAVFVLATLQQIEPVNGQVTVLVICHTQELAFQIRKKYERFSKYMPSVKVSLFFRGLSIKRDKEVLKKNCPHVVVGTPGRISALVRNRSLNLRNVKHFVLDECDKTLKQLDMRRDVLEIFRLTPREKQCMMFSATLSKEIRPVCRKFMRDPMEVLVDDETKLTLHGLQQYYVKLKDSDKNRKLFDLLNGLDFNQVVIFVRSVQRCMALAQLLVEQNFPAIAIHGAMAQEERLSRYQQFKDFQRRILVATNLFGRGMDIESTSSSIMTCLRTWTPTSTGWPVPVALAPKAWLSLLCPMRIMPKSSMRFRVGLKSMWRSFLKKGASPHTLSRAGNHTPDIPEPPCFPRAASSPLSRRQWGFLFLFKHCTFV